MAQRKSETLEQLLEIVFLTENPKSLEEFKRIFQIFVDNHAVDIMEQILKDKNNVGNEDYQDSRPCNDPSQQTGRENRKEKNSLLGTQETHNSEFLHPSMGIEESRSSDGNSEKLKGFENSCTPSKDYDGVDHAKPDTHVSAKPGRNRTEPEEAYCLNMDVVAQCMNTDIATESVTATPTSGFLTQQEGEPPVDLDRCAKLEGKLWKSSDDDSSSESNPDTDQSISDYQSESSQTVAEQDTSELVLTDKNAVEGEDGSTLSQDSRVSVSITNDDNEQKTVPLPVPSLDGVENSQGEHNNSSLESDSHSAKQNKIDNHPNDDSPSSDSDSIRQGINYGCQDDCSASLSSDLMDQEESDPKYQKERESSSDEDSVVFEYTFSDIPVRWQKLESFAAESPHPDSVKVILAYEDVNGDSKLEYCDTFISACERASELAEHDQIRKPWATICVKNCREKNRPKCSFREVPDEVIMSSVPGRKTPYTYATVIGAGGPGLEKSVELKIDTGDDGYSVPYNGVLAHFKNAIFTMGMVNGRPKQMMIAKLKIGEKELPWHAFDVDMETRDWYAGGVPLLEEFIVTLLPGIARAFLFAPELFEPQDRQDGGITIKRREKPMRRESWMAGMSAFRKTH